MATPSEVKEEKIKRQEIKTEHNQHNTSTTTTTTTTTIITLFHMHTNARFASSDQLLFEAVSMATGMMQLVATKWLSMTHTVNYTCL